MKIQEQPYSLNGLGDCSKLRQEITKLDDVLGLDADVPPQESGVVTKALQTGGSFLGGFIPFRGAVRELSGANAARRRMDRAVYAGVARRGFLKGYAEAEQCKTTEELAIEVAETRMGLRTGAAALDIKEPTAPSMTMPVLPISPISEIDLPSSETSEAGDNDANFR